MKRLFPSASLILLLAGTLSAPGDGALAGGKNPLTCSQGNEIRTIDYYMDLNMEDLQRINQEPMDEAQRQLLIEQNTEEFLSLQDRREELIEGCALEIRARNEYWEKGTPPPAAQPHAPAPEQATLGTAIEGETTPIAPPAPTPTQQELSLETTGGSVLESQPEAGPALAPALSDEPVAAAAPEAAPAPSVPEVQGITLEVGGGTGQPAPSEGGSAPLAVPAEAPTTQQGLSQPPAESAVAAPEPQGPPAPEAEVPAAAAQPTISLEYTGETPATGPANVTLGTGESQ